MSRRTPILLALAVPLALGACGSDPAERGVTGAGIGAGTGAVIGALTGGLSIAGGALIGAVVGGGAGALTTKDQINLGEPVWKTKSGGTQSSAAASDHALVADIQRDLGQLGYAAGPADGKMGPATDDAIRRYQADNGLLVDGRPSVELRRHLETKLGRG
jgi:peptidoglycan hydrolase-like protein with peptidoglycan-binding domain